MCWDETWTTPFGSPGQYPPLFGANQLVEEEVRRLLQDHGLVLVVGHMDCAFERRQAGGNVEALQLVPRIDRPLIGDDRVIEAGEENPGRGVLVDEDSTRQTAGDRVERTDRRGVARIAA